VPWTEENVVEGEDHILADAGWNRLVLSGKVLETRRPAAG
jgi:hypothetical protein